MPTSGGTRKFDKSTEFKVDSNTHTHTIAAASMHEVTAPTDFSGPP